MPLSQAQTAKLQVIESTIQSCQRELAMNFDCPAEQILGVYGAKLGLDSKQMRDAIDRFNQRQARVSR